MKEESIEVGKSFKRKRINRRRIGGEWIYAFFSFALQT
jgi:hypothetical protein